MVVDGQVLDVTSFLSEHPGGELAILTFAGRDATEEFNMSLGRIGKTSHDQSSHVGFDAAICCPWVLRCFKDPSA